MGDRSDGRVGFSMRDNAKAVQLVLEVVFGFLSKWVTPTRSFIRRLKCNSVGLANSDFATFPSKGRNP